MVLFNALAISAQVSATVAAALHRFTPDLPLRMRITPIFPTIPSFPGSI